MIAADHLTASEIAALRRAHVDRVDRAAARALAQAGGPHGMPFALQHLGAFLAAEGAALRPSAGERVFGMRPVDYAGAHADSVAAGAGIARRLLAALRRDEDAARLRLGDGAGRHRHRRRAAAAHRDSPCPIPSRKDRSMQSGWRPLSAMSIPALVRHHAELARTVAAHAESGDDRAAHAADARGLAVSAELAQRLQAWLGPVPADAFLGAL